MAPSRGQVLRLAGPSSAEVDLGPLPTKPGTRVHVGRRCALLRCGCTAAVARRRRLPCRCAATARAAAMTSHRAAAIGAPWCRGRHVAPNNFEVHSSHVVLECAPPPSLPRPSPMALLRAVPRCGRCEAHRPNLLRRLNGHEAGSAGAPPLGWTVRGWGRHSRGQRAAGRWGGGGKGEARVAASTLSRPLPPPSCSVCQFPRPLKLPRAASTLPRTPHAPCALCVSVSSRAG